MVNGVPVKVNTPDAHGEFMQAGTVCTVSEGTAVPTSASPCRLSVIARVQPRPA